MASVTQAVLSAAVGEAILGKKIGRKAAILGAVFCFYTVAAQDAF
ncbi:MAG: hypothetical protein ACI8P3_001633 [Saprospiraceae bacterium]|jgi:hypothetical protein